MECEESCVVVDFKGENARLTADHRRKAFGHQVVLLDPYHVVTDTPDSFNPLDAICAGNPQAIDDCRELAKALIVRDPNEHERHWNDMAESWTAAMIATVVRHGEPGLRSLQTVRELLCDPNRLDLAIKLMQESDAWEGMLARMGGQLSYLVDREKASTLTTVSRQLRFLDTPAVAATTGESSFNPADLLKGKMTIYLILPPEHMRAQSSLLRMWIGSMLRAVVRGGLRDMGNVHFVLDEAASLGHLEVIEDAVDKFRGFGIRLQFYYQSIGQLKKCFPDGQDQTLLSNTTQIYFGVNDTATADLISARLGEYTAIVESGGASAGSSSTRSMGAQPQESWGQSSNSNSNWQQQARKLLKPEEVIALPPRVAITFTPGVPPIWSVLLRYYEEPWLGRREGWMAQLRQAGKTLGAAALLLALSLAIAVVFCGAICSLADIQTTAIR
jgi:type IV secretion system protein VirD4